MLKTNFYMPLLAIIVSLLAVLNGTASAYATTAYDNVYHKTDTVFVETHNAYGITTSKNDITANWSHYILDKSTWMSPTANGDADVSFQNALNNGRWGVSQSCGKSDSAGYNCSVIVVWTEDTTLGLEWHTDNNGYISLTTPSSGSVPIHAIQIGTKSYYNDGSGSDGTPIAVSYQANSGNRNISTTYQPNYATNDYSVCYPSSCSTNLFMYVDNTNYPTDYTGTIPSSNNPTVNSPNKPKWYISSIVNNKGSFHDSNFNTFDAVPFTCDGGLAPIITWSLIRHSVAGDIILDSGTQSPTAEINYDFGKADSDRNYTIKGIYDCGPDDPLHFTDFGTLDFTINKVGSLAVNLFDACVDVNFPFIHPDGCLNNLYTTINLLVFGEVKLPSFSFNPACHNLTTMDSWLNLPHGYQVCPAIPSTVRNIVTPFVTFMLGLMTFGWLEKRNNGGDF